MCSIQRHSVIFKRAGVVAASLRTEETIVIFNHCCRNRRSSGIDRRRRCLEMKVGAVGKKLRIDDYRIGHSIPEPDGAFPPEGL